MNIVMMHAFLLPRVQKSPTAPSHHYLLDRVTPQVAEKKITGFSAAYQSMRSLSLKKLKYHAIQGINPQQFNQKIFQKAEKLAQDTRKNIISTPTALENEHLIIFEDGRIFLPKEMIEEKTEALIQQLKEKYPIKKGIELALRQTIAYHLDSGYVLSDVQSKIKEEILQCKNISPQQGRFEVKERLSLFSLLRQQYVDKDHIGIQQGKEIVDFILKELFLAENNDYELSAQIFALKIEREILLKSKKLTESDHETLDTLLPLIDQESSKEIELLCLPEEREILEDFFSFQLKPLVKNTLLNQYSPLLFQQKISEEIKTYIENDLDVKNSPLLLSHDELKEKISEIAKKFCIECPRSTHDFIQCSVEDHMNKEKTLVNFITQFLLESKKSFKYFYKKGFSEEKQKKFHLHIENMLSKNPHLEKIAPDLFNHLKKSAETMSDTGIYLDKKIFGLKNTLIICAKTYDVYALKNSLDEKDVLEIKNQFANMEIRRVGKYVIGKGGFGKVRLAKNIATNNYVAVKKMANIECAHDEINNYKKVGDGENFVSIYNYAEVTAKKNHKKSYLFIEFFPGRDGVQYLQKIIKTKQIDATQNPMDADELKVAAKKYLSCAVELHKKGIFHRDIKPNNFLHGKNGEIKIIDYGFCTTTIDDKGGGTPHYAGPEWNFPTVKPYDAQKHDSFSLGVSLIEQSRAFKVKIEAETEEKQLNNGKKVSCYLGFSNTEILKGHTIDEVAMKLMDEDPLKRITPEEALQLPYFHRDHTAAIAAFPNSEMLLLLHEPKNIFQRKQLEI